MELDVDLCFSLCVLQGLIQQRKCCRKFLNRLVFACLHVLGISKGVQVKSFYKRKLDEGLQKANKAAKAREEIQNALPKMSLHTKSC